MILCALLLGAVIAAVLWGGNAFRSRVLASVPLADGRILRIEGVSFGEHPRIGQPDLAAKYLYWLPWNLRRLITPAMPESKTDLERPGLVVWVDATDVGGKPVDCQRVRVEFVDGDGELWPEDDWRWFGFEGKRSRQAHVFYSFPRTMPTLTFQITPWKTNRPSLIVFANPHLTQPATWTGDPLPQRQKVGGLEIALRELLLRTNGTPTHDWETLCRYWDPKWELRRDGNELAVWEAPEWESEDALGNRGKLPNIHQPVLRFAVTVYPKATNEESAQVLARLPALDLSAAKTNLWNIETRFASNKIVALGCFPKGLYSFLDGELLTNPPVRMTPPGGGAPSGWVGHSMRTSPTHVAEYHGHYTPDPVIYLRSPALQEDVRLAIRLRDEQGRYWTAKPEEEHGYVEQGILPFLLQLPAEVKTVTPEIVALKPVKATFYVDTRAKAATP